MTPNDKVTAACVITVIVGAVAVLAWPLYPFALPKNKDWLDATGVLFTAVTALATFAAANVALWLGLSAQRKRAARNWIERG